MITAIAVMSTCIEFSMYVQHNCYSSNKVITAIAVIKKCVLKAGYRNLDKWKLSVNVDENWNKNKNKNFISSILKSMKYILGLYAWLLFACTSPFSSSSYSSTTISWNSSKQK